MTLIALRIIILLASAYLFGLLIAWLFSWFDNGNGGDDFGDDEPNTPEPQGHLKIDRTSDRKKGKKRLVEVDESYYLEEFDLNKK